MRLPFWYYGGGCGRSSYLVLSRFLFHLQSPFLIVVSNLVLLLAPLKLLKFEGRKKKQRKRRQKKATNCHVTYMLLLLFFISATFKVWSYWIRSTFFSQCYSDFRASLFRARSKMIAATYLNSLTSSSSSDSLFTMQTLVIVCSAYWRLYTLAI